ncbi:MAG: alpha-amylase, partial [Armatimonadetes bacterium]|nr:alpha-amylase [Candidatus Hippobium faecium]
MIGENMKKQHGLHVNAEIRKKCIPDRELYTENGKAEFAEPFSARKAAYNILKEKNISVPSSELFIMSVLETAILALAEKYVMGNRDYFTKVTETVSENFPVEKIFLAYLKEFPTTDVFDGKEKPEDYVKNTGNFISLYLGIIQLWAMGKNPAYEKMSVVFENSLSENSIFAGFADFGENQASLSPIDPQLDINLYNIFTFAYRKHPKNVADQLRCLVERFPYLSEEYGGIVSLALDLYTEETKPVFFGPGEAEVPDYEDDIFLMGEEKYTRDENWMPNAVMLAKNALVWLSQLSEKYNREIKTLDDIPDEELDYMVSCGINALWLIGIWDRSRASKQIKQWTGNPEAESSAYSLRSYSVSEELGGYEAFAKFRNRAKSRNIRLAADMVPNHTAIDSYFLGEHPDWYIQLDYCPFPNYSFTGVSLSDSNDYGVFLEDHYFDRTDASVVFKYEDYRTGKVRYIYHGNDGTNMPWNDTAQLDYLKREVREAVKNIILQVAEDFSIIRFDAAMTLTKKHFQRLWYPEPGRGGDIPTRSAHGLSKRDFDEFFPQEFWREVVDMINEKKPDTLLLAEAFWLLEGYFVRSLGMHRVYNSAFMNMLRDEDNAKYRDAIRMTLLFDRNILKRYVNFMSNPD